MNRSKWRSDEHLARLYAKHREASHTTGWLLEAFAWRRTRWVLWIGFVGLLAWGWFGIIFESATDTYLDWVWHWCQVHAPVTFLSACVTFPWDLTEMRRASRREEARLAQETSDEPKVDAETRS